MSLKQDSRPAAPFDPRVIRRAHAWRRWLEEGQLTREGLLTFRAWLLHSAENRAAYRYIESFEQDGGAQRALVTIERANQLQAPERPRRRARPWRWLLLILLLLALLVGVALVASDQGLRTLPQRLFADYATGVGEQGRVGLPDGTMIQLGSRTAFDLEPIAGGYTLNLVEGEIFVVQSTGSPRLEIFSANGGASAEGARFGYRDVGETATIAVREGEVIALLSGGATDARSLSAGDRIAIDEDGMGPREAAEDPGMLAWRQGLLPRRTWTLEALVAEMRRYHPGLILVVDPDVAEREVDLPPRQATREPLAILRRAAEDLGIPYTESLGGRLILLGDAPWAEDERRGER